jgi:hypothetical protein
MFRIFLAATITIMLLATTAPVFAKTMVKDVVVTADLTAIKTPKPANTGRALLMICKTQSSQDWPILSPKMEQKCRSKLTRSNWPTACNPQSAAGTASSKLVGQVNISHDTDNTKFDSYELTVTFEQAGPFFLPNTDLTAISTDSKDYYDAMIAAFADHIVTKLE